MSWRYRPIALVACVVVAAGCGVRVSNGGAPGADAASGTGDGAGQPDAAAPDAVALGAWGTPQPIATAATNAQEDDGTIAWNGLELVFAKVDSGSGTKHLYLATRATTASPFGTPALVAFASDALHQDESPRFSLDDLTLYFASSRGPSAGGADLWMVTRTAIGAPWGSPTRIGALSSAATEKWVTTCNGGGFLMIRNDANGLGDIYEGTNLANPTLVAELSSTASETGTYLTPDCLTAYFASTRDGTNDLWMATRATPTGTWSAPTKVTEFSTDAKAEQDPWMSADQRTFVFASNASGTNDLYISTR